MADNRHIEEIEQQAALYAIGALPPAEAKLFEQRLSGGCPLCQAEVSACTQAVAALQLSVPEVAPPNGLRARVLESVGAKEKSSKGSPMGPGRIVRPDDTEWTSPAPGISVRMLLGKRTMLVKMEPKSSFPPHDHTAAEQCLVLEGSVSSAGVTAYAGDYTFMPSGSHHADLHTEDGCLLLIAYT